MARGKKTDRAARQAEATPIAPEVPVAPRKRTYLPAEERRQQILEAAREVFSRTSLQGARTRELARAAGINQATLYGHFESKEALFTEAIVQPLVNAMQGMHERADNYQSAASAEDLLALAQESCHNHLESMVEIYPLLTAALFSDPDLGRKLYTEQIAPLFEKRGEAMRGLVKEQITSEFFSLAAFGMFFAVAMDRYFTGKDEDLDIPAARLAELAAFGYARDPRRNSQDS